MHMHGTYSTGDKANLPGIEGYGQGTPDIRYESNIKITKSVFDSQLRSSINTFN